MSEHAPLPWKHEVIEPHEPGKAHRIVAANGIVVCYVAIAADAAFIVQAANQSHKQGQERTAWIAERISHKPEHVEGILDILKIVGETR